MSLARCRSLVVSPSCSAPFLTASLVAVSVSLRFVCRIVGHLLNLFFSATQVSGDMLNGDSCHSGKTGAAPTKCLRREGCRTSTRARVGKVFGTDGVKVVAQWGVRLRDMTHGEPFITCSPASQVSALGLEEFGLVIMCVRVFGVNRSSWRGWS